MSAATPIWVDGPVSGIDARLDGATSGPGGGRIAGRVTSDVDGSPLAGIQVRCFDADGFQVGSCATVTAADGSYALGGNLPAGRYTVRFSSATGDYVAEWYDNGPDISSATTLSVTLGTTVPDVDASLEPAGQISGRVTRPDGTTYPFLSVGAFRWDGSAWVLVTSTTVYDTGDYVLGWCTSRDLPHTLCRLRF